MIIFHIIYFFSQYMVTALTIISLALFNELRSHYYANVKKSAFWTLNLIHSLDVPPHDLVIYLLMIQIKKVMISPRIHRYTCTCITYLWFRPP